MKNVQFIKLRHTELSSRVLKANEVTDDVLS